MTNASEGVKELNFGKKGQKNHALLSGQTGF